MGIVLLIIDHKRNLVITSNEYLTLFHCVPDEFWRCSITMDETGTHLNTSENKQQVSSGLSGWNNAKVGLSGKKLMTTVFWHACILIHVDYLEREERSLANIMSTNWIHCSRTS